jgi:hypothetical protein
MSSFHESGSSTHYLDDPEAYAYPSVTGSSLSHIDTGNLPLGYSEHKAAFDFASSEDMTWAGLPATNDTSQPWTDCIQSVVYCPSDPLYAVPMNYPWLGNEDCFPFSDERVDSWDFVEPPTEVRTEESGHVAWDIRVVPQRSSTEPTGAQQSRHASIPSLYNSAPLSHSPTSDGLFSTWQSYQSHYNPSLAGSAASRWSGKQRASRLHSPRQWMSQGIDEEVLEVERISSHYLHRDLSATSQLFQYIPVSSPESRHGNELSDYCASTPSADSGYVSQSYASTVASIISPAVSATPSANGSETSHQRRRGRKKRRAAPGEVCRDGSTDTAATSSSYLSHDDAHNKHVDAQHVYESFSGTNTKSTVEATTSFEAHGQLEPDPRDSANTGYPGDYELNDHSSDMVDSVMNDYEGEKSADCDTEDHSERYTDADDTFDDNNNNNYAGAFKHFRLQEAVEQAEQADAQETPGRADGSSSSAGSSVPSTISSFMSSRSGLTSTTTFSGGTSSSQSKDRNGLKIAAFAPNEGNTKPLDLICWHAALGMRCKGQTGRSHEARRLYRSVHGSRHKMYLTDYSE